MYGWLTRYKPEKIPHNNPPPQCDLSTNADRCHRTRYTEGIISRIFRQELMEGSGVRGTGVPRHHRGPIKNPYWTCQKWRQYGTEGFKGGPLYIDTCQPVGQRFRFSNLAWWSLKWLYWKALDWYWKALILKSPGNPWTPWILESPGLILESSGLILERPEMILESPDAGKPWC